MRTPTLGQLESLFLARWNSEERDLRAGLALVRDAVLHGLPRARGHRDPVARVRSRRQLETYRELARAHAVVIRRVAQAEGVTVAQILGQDRSRNATRARGRTCWALYRGCKLSFPEAAAITGRRDHTTVMWHVRRVDAEVAADPKLGAKLRRLAA